MGYDRLSGWMDDIRWYYKGIKYILNVGRTRLSKGFRFILDFGIYEINWTKTHVLFLFMTVT